jgi:hypothetical protein
LRQRGADDPGLQKATGDVFMTDAPLKDKDDDLISVVYHASQGVETCRQYGADANKEGDRDVAIFFEEIRDQYAQFVVKGKLSSSRGCDRC